MTTAITIIDSTGVSHNGVKADIYEPESGAWFADVDLDEEKFPSGTATLKVGDLPFVGTVDDRFTGSFTGQKKIRIVAGGNGWSKELGRKGYHNDAGVKGLLVAQDAARECGEALAEYSGVERFSNDYARPVGLASLVIGDCATGVSWWVDRDGKTHVAKRAAQAVSSDVQVLDWDARAKIATLACEDLSQLRVGYQLADERLGSAQTIRELHTTTSAGSFRVMAWCGGADGEGARLPRLIEALVRQAMGSKLFGKYRYRVVSMAADGRVNCQAVRKSDGVPDLLPLPQWEGLAGSHAELTPGAEVLVEFIGGERDEPIVTGYIGKDGAGHVPQKITIGDKSKVAGVARMSDVVTSGGVNCTIMFSALSYPGGGVPGPVTPGVVGAPTIMPNVPYLVSFGDIVVPPTPPVPATSGDPLLGYILSASDLLETQ